MSGLRAVLVMMSLFLFGWGLILLILEPGPTVTFLFPQSTGSDTGSHFYLIGPLAVFPGIAWFLAGIPWFIYCGAGALVAIAVLAAGAHRHRPLTHTLYPQAPKWKDPRTRFLDSLRRELRRFR